MRDAKKEAALQLRHERIGEFLEAVQEGRGAEGCEGGRVTGIRIRLPTEEDPSALVVVKVATETGSMIGFVGAYRVADAILAWRARCLAGTMKWREDVPWSERG